MAKFTGSEKLNNNGFSILPEGEYAMMIEDAEFNELSLRLKLTFKLENGRKHFETLFFTKSNDTVNQVAVDEAIRIVRASLQDDSILAFDSDDVPNIIGKYIQAEIVHNEWQGTKRARLNPFNFKEANGFGGAVKLVDLD